jgi:peptide/nickel transport system permease protein
VLALPEFVVASLLVLVLALWAGLLPAVTVTTASGWPADPRMLVLPVLALALPQIGWNTRIVRAALADQYQAPHVDAAILDGLHPWRVLLHHVLPGALPAIAVGAATSVGMLLGGTVVVETIFGHPGIGSVIAGAVADRDTPVIAGATAVSGAAITVVLLGCDLIRTWATGRRP